mgnify:CR=1 FL=1
MNFLQVLSPGRSGAAKTYDLRGDVWALGLTVVEMALLKYPYHLTNPEANAYSIVTIIAKGPAPELPADRFSPALVSFVADCLQMDPDLRPKYIKPPVKAPERPCLLVREVNDEEEGGGKDGGEGGGGGGEEEEEEKEEKKSKKKREDSG